MTAPLITALSVTDNLLDLLSDPVSLGLLIGLWSFGLIAVSIELFLTHRNPPIRGESDMSDSDPIHPSEWDAIWQAINSPEPPDNPSPGRDA